MSVHRSSVVFSLLVPCILGCSAAQHHPDRVAHESAGSSTAGAFQREVKLGMPSTAVVETLGAPNLVTTDEQERAVWVYDRLTTERIYAAPIGGISTLILSDGGAVHNESGSGATAAVQRPFTVIIRFDAANRVDDFTYHTSRF